MVMNVGRRPTFEDADPELAGGLAGLAGRADPELAGGLAGLAGREGVRGRPAPSAHLAPCARLLLHTIART